MRWTPEPKSKKPSWPYEPDRWFLHFALAPIRIGKTWVWLEWVERRGLFEFRFPPAGSPR